ncbi:MAG: hypothetical protein SangKO_041170 [Sandaracinaceae bacterium]
MLESLPRRFHQTVHGFSWSGPPDAGGAAQVLRKKRTLSYTPSYAPGEGAGCVSTSHERAPPLGAGLTR